MSLCKSNATFDLTNPADDQLPAESRPALVCRFLSAAGHKQLIQSLDNAGADVDALSAVYGSAVVGWRNFTKADGTPAPAEFTPAALAECLTSGEMYALAQSIPVAMFRAELERLRKPAEPAAKA